MGGSLTMKNGRIDKELDRMHGLDWYDYGARHIIMDVTWMSRDCPLTSCEIAGHAEPRLNDDGNGKVINSVEIENTIRRETNEKERKEEPGHDQ